MLARLDPAGEAGVHSDLCAHRGSGLQTQRDVLAAVLQGQLSAWQLQQKFGYISLLLVRRLTRHGPANAVLALYQGLSAVLPQAQRATVLRKGGCTGHTEGKAFLKKHLIWFPDAV